MSIGKGLCCALVALVLMSNFGCLVGGGSTTKREGNFVAEATLQTIEPGKTTKAWVLATLGNPTSKTEVEPGHELWKYSYKETKDSGGYVFLIFAGGDKKITDGNVFVELKDGTVTKSWRG